MRELQEDYSTDDLVAAHAVIDAFEQLEADLREEQE